MIVETVLLLVQVALLFILALYSAAGARNELERVVNPACWFAFFYTLWMLIPQIFVLTAEHPVIGLEHISPSERAAATLPTQGYLIAFMVSVMLGYMAAGLFAARRPPGAQTTLPLETTHWWFAAAAFAVGGVAFFILGRTYAGLPEGTMRSALVKSPSGRLLMAISFFASFAAAYLSSHLWLQRRRLAAVALFAVYVLLVFQINARGRMMWPMVLATVFVWIRGARFPLAKVAPLGIVAMVALSLIDPLFISLRTGDMTRFYEALDPLKIFETLFYDRNFDGFANIMFITQQDLIPENPIGLLTGSRDSFMNTYYPDVYAMGVAFPTTVPGEFWLAGKSFFLVAFGLIYGLLLGSLNNFIRQVRIEAHLWLYLAAMPWIAFVGGELAESVDKMIAACGPAIVWTLAIMLFGRRRAQISQPLRHS